MDTDLLYAPYREERTRIFNEKISNDRIYPHAGVRIPVLRKLAKGLDPDDIDIKYHEDVILKGLAIANMKAPFSEKLGKLDELLPLLSAWDMALFACVCFTRSGCWWRAARTATEPTMPVSGTGRRTKCCASVPACWATNPSSPSMRCRTGRSS